MPTPHTQPWSFIHVTDIHIGSPDSYRFNPAINENWDTAAAQIRARQPDLLLVGGDLTRDGNLNTFELDASAKALDALGMPWHAVPGNMDTGNKHAPSQGALDDRDDVACNVTSAQCDVFRRHISPLTWSFVYRDVRFSGCYEALAGTSLAEADELEVWLDRLADLPRARWHVMLNHYPLFVETPNDPPRDHTAVADYHNWYFSVDPAPRRRLLEAYRRSGVTHVLSGHIHCRRPPFTIDGITYCFGASTAFGQWADRWPDGDARLGFNTFTVTPSGLDCHFEPLSRVSTRKDARGPGGHPKPEARNAASA